jgi:hypothetical protein
MVARMISTNSLAAFTQEVNRTRPSTVEPGQAQPVSGGGSASPRAAAPPQQRTLDAVPPAPALPLPRGSLLDLRA